MSNLLKTGEQYDVPSFVCARRRSAGSVAGEAYGTVPLLHRQITMSEPSDYEPGQIPLGQSISGGLITSRQIRGSR